MAYKWRYELRKGIEVIQTKQGRALLSNHPLRLFPINGKACELMEASAQKLSLEELITKHQELPPAKIISFMDSLVQKGLLNRVYNPTLNATDVPQVSVIVPVRNRAEDIQQCLESILNCHYPQDKVEIIVVDDGSTDHTKEVIKQYPVQLIVMEQNVGQSRCRNVGVAAAKADLIAFTDSDCIVDKHWLNILTEPFADPSVGIVGGGVSSHGTDKVLDRYEQACSPLHMGEQGGPIGPQQQIPYIPTCNVLIRKKAFQLVGGFSEEMRVGEDVDLIWRILQNQYTGFYLPEGSIQHRHRNQLHSLMLRRAQYASSEAILEKQFNFNRKKLFISPWHLINLIIFLGLYFGSAQIIGQQWQAYAPTLVACCGISMLFSLCSEIMVKKLKLQRLGLEISIKNLLKPIWRSHLAFLGYITAIIARYYSIYLMLLSLVFPALLGLLLLVFLVSAYFDYTVKKPMLNYPTFLLVYMIEKLAYQLGVIYGCFKYKNITPMFHWVKFI